MVQISTPGVTPNRGMGPREALLSNYFDLLFGIINKITCISGSPFNRCSGRMHMYTHENNNNYLHESAACAISAVCDSVCLHKYCNSNLLISLKLGVIIGPTNHKN